MEQLGLIRGLQMFSVGVLVAFSVLHLVMYQAQPARRVNLIFGFALLAAAAATFLDYESQLHSGPVELNMLRAQRPLMGLFLFLLLLTVYRLYEKPTPRMVLWLGAGLGVIGLLSIWDPHRVLHLMYIGLGLLLVPLGSATWREIRGGRHNARPIGVGLVLLLVAFLYDIAIDEGLFEMSKALSNGYPFGMMALLVGTSTALARDSAQVERRLAKSEVQQGIAQAELARRQHDLAEARKLQESFLPDCAPELTGFDICFSQRTASEVGGDYYDYAVSSEGMLTLVVGDATGHGTRAGLMVAVAKSLFHRSGATEDVSPLLSNASDVIKEMKLGNMFMGLAVLRFGKRTLEFGSAGMPAMLLRRAGSTRVESFVHKTMPLGAVRNHPYPSSEHTFETGDLLVLTSDGLAECFNGDREQLSMERIEEAVSGSRATSAQGLVAELFELADTWREAQELEDDVTIAVVRRIDSAHPDALA